MLSITTQFVVTTLYLLYDTNTFHSKGDVTFKFYPTFSKLVAFISGEMSTKRTIKNIPPEVDNLVDNLVYIIYYSSCVTVDYVYTCI